jgi:putative transposase
MKHLLIDEEKSHHTISRLCRALGVTRAGYYAHKTRPTSRRRMEDAHLKELIEKAFADSHQTYGAPRIHAELVLAHGLCISRKRVARLMRELEMAGVSRRKGRGRRRKLAPETAAAPDLVRRNFNASSPNELWVADITYVPTWEGWLFLAVVTDVFTKRIVGWSMRNDITAEVVVDALGMAATMQRPGPDLVHHSDRGAQGEFKRSSQHLDTEELRWGQEDVGEAVVRCVRRCVHLAGLPAGVGSTSSGSGSRSLAGCRARTRLSPSACHPRSVRASSVKVAACEQSAQLHSQVGTCPSPNEKRSPSSTQQVAGCVRLLRTSVARPRRSRENSGETRRRTTVISSIGPPRRSGMPIDASDGPRSPNSPKTTRFASTSRSASPGT